MNYAAMLEAEHPYTVPPVSKLDVFFSKRKPRTPRNWIMVGESYLKDETANARQEIDRALDDRREFVDAWRALVRENINWIAQTPEARREWTEPWYVGPVMREDKGVAAFPIGEVLVQVERDFRSLRVVTARLEHALPVVEQQRRLHGNRDRSLGRSSYKGPGDVFGYPIIEYIDLSQYEPGYLGGNESDVNGLSYMSDRVYRKPKPGMLGYGEKGVRLPQKNTTAARDAILYFARRLRLGNLELPTVPPAVL